MSEKVFDEIKKVVEISCSGHNIDHVNRVYNLALKIASKEKNIDWDVLKAAILLHDIGGIKEQDDFTGKTDHAIEGAKMAEPILRQLKFSEEKIVHIKDCIISHRYKTDNKPKTIEAKILFDADKLDAVGAIGIARGFVWVGRNNAHIYRKPENLQNYIKENYENGKINGRIKNKSKHSPQIEFETKTKFLKKRIYTKEGKKILKERTLFYKKFLYRLEKEVLGKM
jgi:uncharacterized protein